MHSCLLFCFQLNFLKTSGGSPRSSVSIETSPPASPHRVAIVHSPVSSVVRLSETREEDFEPSASLQCQQEQRAGQHTVLQSLHEQ